MVLKFNKNELTILNELCLIQIESYRYILEKELLKGDKNLLEALGSSLQAAEREAKWAISQYKEVLENPLYLGILESQELSTLRHILFHSEDIYIEKGYAQDIRLIWQKFFSIEEHRNLIIKTSVNHGKKKIQVPSRQLGHSTMGHLNKVQ